MISSALLPRERILQAARALLETGGVEAVSTRAVSAAAGVQPPTIYRQFGDMRGLLNEVAAAGFLAYLQTKTSHTPAADPVEELRRGWNMHVEFGLTHPHFYTLMYGTPRHLDPSPAAVEAFAMLESLMERLAAAGQLAVGVEQAALMVHSGAVGTTLNLMRTGAKAGSGLSDLMRETVLGAILNPHQPLSVAGDPVRQQAATHAVSLGALLPRLKEQYSEAEQGLLAEWLKRLF